MRESQFAVLKETVKKLILALETQNLNYAQHQSMASMDIHGSKATLQKSQSNNGPLYPVASVQQLAYDFVPGSSTEKLDLPTKDEEFNLPKIKDS